MTQYASSTDEELITLLRNGDKLAEEALYARYKQIVRSKARTYFLIGADREDIIQEGMIGLYKAVCDFQFEKKASFRAFAELCITRQIITAIKSATRKKHMPLNTYVSLNRSFFEGESDRPLIDVLSSAQISDPEDVYISRESYAAIADRIEHSLSKLEHDALGLYLQGYSYQQIADALKKSTKSVDNAIQRVKKKLEEHLRGVL
jgi:RNA polymerase sporulation-specific sigma factor